LRPCRNFPLGAFIPPPTDVGSREFWALLSLSSLLYLFLRRHRAFFSPQFPGGPAPSPLPAISPLSPPKAPDLTCEVRPFFPVFFLLPLSLRSDPLLFPLSLSGVPPTMSGERLVFLSSLPAFDHFFIRRRHNLLFPFSVLRLRLIWPSQVFLPRHYAFGFFFSQVVFSTSLSNGDVIVKVRFFMVTFWGPSL